MDGHGAQMRILLVEDSPSDVALTREVFAAAAADVHLDVAMDGVQALEHLEAAAEPPDLILLDLNMPRMGGMEVLDRLKSHPEHRRIPVIVLTTSQASADILGTYDRHANSFITKPVDVTDFITVVERIRAYWLATVQLPSRTAS